jgi:hypothetical protein
MNDYGFVERYRWADKEVVDRVYRAAVDRLGATDVKRAGERDDRGGVDFWATVPGRDPMGIDVKKRSSDWPDVCLETLSIVEKGIAGWAVDPHKRTDLLLILWPSRSLLVSYPQVRAATIAHREEWLRLYPQRDRAGRVRDTSTEGRYHTQNVYVPEAVLLDAIYPELRSISLLPAKDVWRAMPRRCFTCGRPPVSRFPDGSPLYDCSHDAVTLLPPDVA